MRAPKLKDNVEMSKRRLESVRRYLKAKNEKFKKLSKKEQRIQIAKDVIAQLKAKKIEAASTYLDPHADIPYSYMYEDGCYDTPQEEDKRKKYEKDFDKLQVGEVTCQVKCDVCGIGSLFVAAVENADKLKVKDFAADYGEWSNRGGQVCYLEKWFPSDMLDLIEAYFEVGCGHPGDWSPIRREPNSETRLIMIMENIISNGGKFDPTKGKHAEINPFKGDETF